jgi:hypothetical protein
MQKAPSIINKNELPMLDNELVKKDAEIAEESMGYQKNKFYGKGIDINLDFKKVASVQQMGDSGKLYLYQITSPSAYALQVYFDAFKLPPGAKMYFYDKDKTMFLGSFTSQNNFANNTFGTTFIDGNTAVIEYYEPNQVAFESLIHISKISHVFLYASHGPFSKGNKDAPDYWGASPCNINVNCELGYGWDREKKSVALILAEYKVADRIGYNYSSIYFGWCSGALINNTAQDGRPYFLTARHCLDLNEDTEKPMDNAKNWLFLFNHEAPNCADNGSSVSASISQSVFGAFVRSIDDVGLPKSDYLLLELDAWPETLKGYGAVYAGWETSEYDAFMSPFTVGIHHPVGDVKKISKDNNPPVSDVNSYFWNVSWDQGITEQGSSGSPLFNSAHKIIGQLNGGQSKCSNQTGIDRYGKFSKSFDNGSFRGILDPLYTMVSSLGSYNPSKVGEHCYNNIQDVDKGETGVDCGSPDCVPCSWVTTVGWGANPLSNNKVMDKAQGETGVDCGGPNCKPCGGDAQCSNGIKDGDETDVDCGGSCIPCAVYCQGQVIYDRLGLSPVIIIVEDLTNLSRASNFDSRPAYTSSSDIIEPNNGDLLPAYTSVSNFIEAGNSHVNSGEVVTFKSAGSIKLKTGFSAKQGSTFKAKYETCQKCKKLNLYYYPIAMSKELRISQSGADRYDITVLRYNQSIYSSSGYIFEKNPCLWNSGNTSMGAYRVIINLYNDCSGEKKTLDYIISIVPPSNINSLVSSTNDIIDDENTIITIYPNPSRGVVSIKNYSDEPIITINVYNSQGQQIIHQEYNNTTNLTDIVLDRYSNGIYMIQIKTAKNTYTKSIILKK